MKVYLNDKDGQKKIVEAELIQDRKYSVIVKLEDGNKIVRNKKRHVVTEE
jgi:hypothetical protein